MVSLIAVIFISGIMVYGLVDLAWSKWNDTMKLHLRQLELEKENHIMALTEMEHETGLFPTYTLEEILR